MILTQEQLDEVDRIIKETVVITEWTHDGNEPDDDSYELDDAGATLVSAARRVREYLSTL